MSDDILFGESGSFGLVTLNRPRALNALTLEMVNALDRRLAQWAGDGAVRGVLVEGAGDRAFAAGGDVQRLHEAGLKGDPYTEAFFRDEYALNRRIFHYPKPYIALMDGIAMGGGVGVSVLGSHRVATERTAFAMPETGIGFFPDVGATYFLPRLPGRLGLYLALTGARLGSADCCHAGIATHYVPRDRLAELKAELAASAAAGIGAGDGRAAVDAVLGRFAEDPGPPPVAVHLERIDACFGRESVEAVLDALDAEGTEWAGKTAAAMAAKSPTALKVAFEQYRRGGSLGLDAALRLEYGMSQVFMRNRDFFEGVRALIIDKDNTPRWEPPSLAEVGADAVAEYFGAAEPDPPFGDPDRAPHRMQECQ